MSDIYLTPINNLKELRYFKYYLLFFLTKGRTHSTEELQVTLGDRDVELGSIRILLC